MFDPAQYLANNPDVAQAVAQGLITAWDHFELFGGAEGRTPTPLFDEAFYLQQNPDVAQAIANGQIASAAQHFVLFGQSEPRAINPAIDLGRYLGANPDIANAVANGVIEPFAHLLQFGVNEGRNLGNGVRLSEFSNDPSFIQALTNGNPAQALGRVESVAPFLPAFERPSGWTPPASTPIPVDFVPPAGSGIRLVVPPEVTVPPGIVLPPVFDPPTPTPTPTPTPGDDPPAPATFDVLNTSGELTFTGTATGDITVSWSGGIGSSVATFTRNSLTKTADFSGSAQVQATSIKLGASDVLSVSKADITGVTITGTGTVKLSDTTLTAANLKAVDTTSSAFIDASAVTSITDASVADAKWLLVTHQGTSGDKIKTKADVAVTLAAGADVALADLKGIQAATTGLVDAQAITSVTGTTADAVLLLVTNEGTSGDKINMKADVGVTLTDAASIANLTTIDNANGNGALTYSTVKDTTANVRTNTGGYIKDAINVTLMDLIATSNLSVVNPPTTGTKTAQIRADLVLNGAADLGSFGVSIDAGKTLTATAAQLSGRSIAGTGNVIVYGSEGAQNVTGGDGDDVFILVGTTAPGQYTGSDPRFANLTTLNDRATSQVQTGEVYNGAGGNNTLHVYGTTDLSGVTISNFKTIILHSDATFSADQMTALNTLGATVIGDGASALRVASNGAATVDMTNVKLQAIGQFDLAQSLTAQIDQVNGLNQIGTLSVANGARVEGAGATGLDFSGRKLYGAGSVNDGKNGNGVVALTAIDAASKLGLGLGAHLNDVVNSVTALINQMNEPIANGGLVGVPGYQTQDTLNLNVSTMSLFLGSQAVADVIKAGTNAAFLRGGPGNDILIGGSSTNFMSGAGGNDTITGGALRDFIAGDEGDDSAYGMGGNDFINTQAGNDTIYGGAGQDFIMPGDGSDTVIVDDEPDFISLYSSTTPSQVDGATDTIRIETKTGLTSTVMNNIVGFDISSNGAEDKLLFKESVFINGNLGGKSVVGTGSSASGSKFDLKTDDFMGIVKITDNAAGDFSNVGDIIAAAVSNGAANDAFIFLIDNGVNTMAIGWDDRVVSGGNANGQMDLPAEFTPIAILVGIVDVSALDTGNLGLVGLPT